MKSQINVLIFQTADQLQLFVHAKDEVAEAVVSAVYSYCLVGLLVTLSDSSVPSGVGSALLK